MIKLPSLLPAVLLPLLAGGQRSLEVQLAARYDLHADYTTRYFLRSYTNHTQLFGWSYGLHARYRYPLRPRLHALAGLGLYRLGVSKVLQNTPFGLLATARDINYRHPSGILPGFSTGHYHYGSLALSGSLAYQGRQQGRHAVTLAAGYRWLYAFSRSARLTYNNIRYREAYRRPLGFGIDAAAGMTWKLGKGNYYLHPQLVLPVYQQLSGDPAFGEDRQVRMTKWGQGIGVALSVGRYFPARGGGSGLPATGAQGGY